MILKKLITRESTIINVTNNTPTKETIMETKIVNGHKMTTLVHRMGEGPLEIGTTHLGTYLWEKVGTVSIAQLTGEKRETKAWKTVSREGITAVNGRLRCWLKQGARFCALSPENLRWDWEGSAASEAVEALCLRNGFSLAPGANLRNRILCTNYATAIAKFGESAICGLAGMALHLIKADGDMTAFFKRHQIQPLDQPRILEMMRAGNGTGISYLLFRQALGLPMGENLGSKYHATDFKFSVGWAKNLPVEWREDFAAWGPVAAENYSEFLTTLISSDQPLPPFTLMLEDWLIAARELSASLELQKQLEKSAPKFKRECRKWQEQGLMTENEQGYLLWKCVRKDGRGMLDYPYQVGTRFNTTDGMATVGPWGAVKEYGREDLYVLALRVTQAGLVFADNKVRKGVMYAFEGVPVAQYRITEKTHEGFTPLLMTGVDEMAALTGTPTQRDSQPYVPFETEKEEEEKQYPAIQCLGRCDWCDNLIDVMSEGKYGEVKTYTCSFCGHEKNKGVVITHGEYDPAAQESEDCWDPFKD